MINVSEEELVIFTIDVANLTTFLILSIIINIILGSMCLFSSYYAHIGYNQNMKLLKGIKEKNNFTLNVLKEETLKHNGNNHAFLNRIDDYQRTLDLIFNLDKFEKTKD